MLKNYLNIIYISHGSEKFHIQTKFSVLTLLHFLDQLQFENIRICIYTDAPSYFPTHPLIRLFPLTPKELSAYKGKLGYVHRIKLAILQRASMEVLENPNSKMLYVDCDTRWLKFPSDQLLDFCAADAHHPVALMHILEGTLSNPLIPYQYLQFIESHPKELGSFGIHDISKIEMWNAGAIGISSNPHVFFTKALEITDYLVPRVLPTNWIEQLVVSMLACNTYQMHALGSDVLHHYWNNSFEAPFYLKTFFSKVPENASLLEQASLCANHSWNLDEIRELGDKLKMKKRVKKWLRSPLKLYSKTKIKLLKTYLN